MVEAGTKGSNQAVLTRRDGSKLIINTNTGKVEREYDNAGKRIIRIEQKTSSSGTTRFSKIEDQKEVEISRRLQVAKDQEAEYQKAVNKSNFSGSDGTLYNYQYEINQQPLKDQDKYAENRAMLDSANVLVAAPKRNRIKEAISDFESGFLGGFGLKTQDYRGNVSDRVRSPGGSSFAEQTGFLGGSISQFLVPKAGKAVFNVNAAAVKGFQATTAGRFLGSNQALRLTTQVGVGSAQFAGIVTGASAVGSRTLTPTQRELLKLPQTKDALKIARAAEKEAVYNQGFNLLGVNVNPRAVAFELGGSVFAGKKGKYAYEESLRNTLKNSNINSYWQDQAVSAGLTRRSYRNTGEVLGFLNIARLSERIGQRELERQFSRTPLTRSSKAARGLAAAGPIGRAGFVEGFSQEVGQQVAREQDISLKEATIMGSFGVLSAASIGGVIASGGRFSKTVKRASYTTDWYEKAGDVLADFQSKAARTTPKTVFAITPSFNAFSKTPIRTTGFSITPSRTMSSVNSFDTKSNVGVFSNAITPTNTFTKTNVYTFTKTNTPVNPFVNVPTNINPNIPVSINPFVNTVVSVPTRFAGFPVVPTSGGGFGYSVSSKGRKKKSFKTPTLFNNVFGVRKGISDITGLGFRF